MPAKGEVPPFHWPAFPASAVQRIGIPLKLTRYLVTKVHEMRTRCLMVFIDKLFMGKSMTRRFWICVLEYLRFKPTHDKAKLNRSVNWNLRGSRTSMYKYGNDRP